MKRDAIFVFGSNEGGFHGAGAAKFALDFKGAILRQPVGRQGQSYAIPTKDVTIRYTLPLPLIEQYVYNFLEYAVRNPELDFQVTRIGCGRAGLKNEQVAPMFKNAPDNCWFDEAWIPYLNNKDRHYWGSK
jgi:hypothetical protein